MDKAYLGDAVYIEKDDSVPGGIILTTEDGIEIGNRIFMEFEVLAAFVQYVAKIDKEGT